MGWLGVLVTDDDDLYGPEVTEVTVSEWMDVRCVRVPEARVATRVLWEDFVSWLGESGGAPPTLSAFGQMLSRAGVRTARTGRRRERVGLLLKSDAAAEVGSLTARLVDEEGNACPPSFLSPAMQEWFRATAEEYQLEEHHLMILADVAILQDISAEALETLRREGLTRVNTHGNLVTRREVEIHRQTVLAKARLLGALGLDEVEDRS